MSTDRFSMREAVRFGWVTTKSHFLFFVGILLAAEAIVRAVTGTVGQRLDASMVEHYRDFVHAELLEPLGMGSSSLRPPAAWDGTGRLGTARPKAGSATCRRTASACSHRRR